MPVNDSDQTSVLPAPSNVYQELVAVDAQQVYRVDQTGVKLTKEQLACALYEGTPHLYDLAETLARAHGQAGALCPYDLQGEEVKWFWQDIAQQLIDHASEWEENSGSACSLSDQEMARLKDERADEKELHRANDRMAKMYLESGMDCTYMEWLESMVTALGKVM